MVTLNLCLIGFGSAGKEFTRLLLEKHSDILLSTGFDVKITAVCTKTKGNLFNQNGINLKDVIEHIDKHGSFQTFTDRTSLGVLELINASRASVLIELSTLSIKDGEPAITHIKTAFDNNMHVITGNKGPIAWRYDELQEIAHERGLNFLFETTVMDGTPIFNLVKYSLPGCRVTGFKGILNSTTNFILEEMERGCSFNDAVKEAQRRGFAEGDGALDINGSDAAAKTAALANVLMSADITPDTVSTTGIQNITSEKVIGAKTQNKKIKLLCEASLLDGKVIASVKPDEFPIGHVFSTIDATSSILCITTDLMGEICILEKNPEILQTAYGIYSDLLNLIRVY